MFFTKEGTVALPASISAQVTADRVRFGADGYYLLHNHPSGHADPSRADVAFTRMVQNEVEEFQGQVIIDHMNTPSSTMTASMPDHPRRAELLREMDSQMFRDVKGIYFPPQRFDNYLVAAMRAVPAHSAKPTSTPSDLGGMVSNKHILYGRTSVWRGRTTPSTAPRSMSSCW